MKMTVSLERAGNKIKHMNRSEQDLNKGVSRCKYWLEVGSQTDGLLFSKKNFYLYIRPARPPAKKVSAVGRGPVFYQTGLH